MNIYNLFYKAPAPEGIEERNAHIIGGGIAGLAAAVFLIDDAGMPGKNITLYEKRNSLGGCCDAYSGEAGYICPGERELEPFMECLWYLCSKIPSLEDPSISVLDESVRANKDMPIHSESRLLCKQGHIYEKVHDYRMSPELLLKMEHFTSIPEKDLEDMTIEDYFGKDSEFFHSSLWWCYHSMLAFKPYHSALEAQRYFNRFGLLNRLDYLEGILHTKRNDKDSVIKPIHKWLEDQGVTFRMDTAVYDLEMDEVPRDVVFTIETSVRTPLEAVYMLTCLDKEIIEVNPARYDLRYIKERVMKFGGMKGKITEEDLPKINPLKLWLGKAKLIKELLKKANEIPPYYIMYPGRDKSIALKDSVLKPQFPKDSR